MILSKNKGNHVKIMITEPPKAAIIDKGKQQGSMSRSPQYKTNTHHTINLEFLGIRTREKMLMEGG
jgi:hypothetical protein